MKSCIFANKPGTMRFPERLSHRALSSRVNYNLPKLDAQFRGKTILYTQLYLYNFSKIKVYD